MHFFSFFFYFLLHNLLRVYYLYFVIIYSHKNKPIKNIKNTITKKVQEVVLKDSPNETKDPEGGCQC